MGSLSLTHGLRDGLDTAPCGRVIPCAPGVPDGASSMAGGCALRIALAQ